MNNSFIARRLFVLAAMAAWTNFSFAAATSINDLTSQKKAEEISAKIKDKETSPPTMPIERATSSPRVGVHAIGLGLGQTVLLGKFRDRGDDAVSADLLYSYSASYSFDMLVEGSYSKHEFKNDEATMIGASAGIKAKFFQFDSFSPFGIGGFGFYAPQVKQTIGNETVQSEQKLTFGYHFGGGCDLLLNDKFMIGMILHLHHPFKVNQENGTQVEGSYIRLAMTGMYRF